MRMVIFVWLYACFFSFVAVAENRHLVLFEQADLSISSLEHKEFENLLKSTNEKDVKQLADWLARQGRRTTPKDLWLIRGAKLKLESTLAQELEKQPWVHRVVKDRFRKFIPYADQLSVKDHLKDLQPENELPWGLTNMGLKKIRKEFPHLDGSGVRVGILDSGIQSRHPEFRRQTPDGGVHYSTVHFKDLVNPLDLPYDDNGHGTHVAGTIAGAEVGVAPNAKLLVGKIFTASGMGYDSDIIEGMQWMFDPDGQSETEDYPQIVNNSWGAGLAANTIYDIQEFEPYRRAVQAWIVGGIIPVFAAGNSGETPNGVPGGLPEVISVGAIDGQNQVASFSSRGPNLWKIGNSVLALLKPDVSAPGVEINSTFPGNKYASWDGTSMATPHVAGAIALAIQANPKLTYSKLKSLLYLSSERKADNGFGYGILNAYQLIKMAVAH